MGKSSIIIALGLSVIVAFFILKLNGNSKENLSVTVNMFEQTQARLIANTGVEIYLEKLYADTTLINTTSSSQNIFNGSYVVNLSGTLPNVRVTSTATFQGVNHTSVADALLEPISLPVMPGGFYISATAVENAKLTGAMIVNGSNHDTLGVIKGDGKPAVYGIAVDSEGDKLKILSGISKPQNLVGLLDATGEIGFPSVEVSNLGYDWGKIYQYLANAADTTIIGSIPNGSQLGTLARPKITLINADASSTKSISLSQTTGSGILIINGNVKFEGNFIYQGIVLCYKNSNLTFQSTGTNLIVGGLIAAGKFIDVSIAGTMDIRYSPDILNLIKFRLKANGFKLLSWYE